MKKIKKIFQEKIIVSAVMCALLAVVLVTVTYGWYLMHDTAKMYGLELKTAFSGGIKVALEPGGEDIMSDPTLERIEYNNTVMVVIPINLSNFSNIQEQRIAPGAYGPLPFYITSLSETITSYTIRVQLEYKPSTTAVSAADRQRIESWMRDHFSIYRTKYEENGIVKFADPLPYYMGEPNEEVITAEGPLVMNEEELAELYWVWNYELTDIPDYQTLSRFPTYNKTGAGLTEAIVRQAVRQYDEEDTTLGNYVEDIWFNIYIEGGQGVKGD